MNHKLNISVVLGSYNRKKFLKLTINSIRNELKNQSYELIVVDGGSTDGTTNWLAKQKDIITIIQHNRGRWMEKEIKRRSWGYFMNLGFKTAQGKYICMLSDDCLVIPGAIVNGVSLFDQVLRDNKKIGAIAFYWRDWPQEKEYRVGLTLGNKMFVNHGLFLNKALQDVYYVNENNFMFYHADGDLCLKMWQAGYSCIPSSDSYIEHYSHANLKVKSSNLEWQKKDWQTYLQKWTGIFYDDKTKLEGDWIKKQFNDKHQTINQLKYIHFFKKIERKLSKLMIK